MSLTPFRFITLTVLILFWIFGGVIEAIDDPSRESPGLHNVLKAAESVYLGSEPDGEVGFESLKELGITTVISVDGAKPDIETARRLGLRYFHIPIGYDGIDGSAALALTRVARDVQAPVYVHCHHGRHRGPAAVAVLCIAAGSLDHEQAVAIMTKAGTGKDFPGLWRDVKNFKPPSPDTPLPELVEVATVDSLAAAMAKLDRHFDNLKLCAVEDWKSPASHPDLEASAEALLVQEGLYECLRTLSDNYDDNFKSDLKASESLTSELQSVIKSKDGASAHRLLKAVEKSCVECHTAYRNH